MIVLYFRSIISKVDNETSVTKTKPLKSKKIIFDIEENDDDEPVSKKRKLDSEVEDKIKHKKKKKKIKEENDISFEELNNYSNHSGEVVSKASGSHEKKEHKKKKRKE